MIFIGIDPGKRGALAMIRSSDESKDIYDIPMIDKKLYDIAECVELLREIKGDEVCICAIEKQQSMPKQGVASSFSTGQGYGMWLGILAALGIPYEEVRPAKWKKTLKIPADKSEALAKTKARYPDAALKRHDHGDALMLAVYIMETTG